MTEPIGTPDPTVTPDSPESITRTCILAFFAADHVAVADNKMYVNGGFFNLLRFPSFPAILPTLGIGAALRIPFHDSMQNHSLRITLRGPEGQQLGVRVEAIFRTAPTLEAQFGEAQLVPFGVTVANVDLPSPGVYTLVLELDNVEKGTYPVRATQVPMAPTVFRPGRPSDPPTT